MLILSILKLSNLSYFYLYLSFLKYILLPMQNCINIVTT